MRDHAEPVEFPVVGPGSSFPIPGAAAVAAAWSDRAPEEMFPRHSEKAKTMSAAMLVLGAALLLVVPLGGALLLVSGGLGLAICWETPMGGLGTVPSIARATIAPSQASSSTDH